jgi:hypothetical protein
MTLKENILYKNECPAPDWSGSPAVIKAIFSRSNRATSGSSCCENRKKAFIARARAQSWNRHKKAISGKAGVIENFHVTQWYPDTPPEECIDANVKWALYYVEEGKTPERILENNTGDFTFMEYSIGKDYIEVGYVHEPELDNASATKIRVVLRHPKATRQDLK